MGKTATLPNAEELQPGQELTDDQKQILTDEKEIDWDAAMPGEETPKKKEDEGEEGAKEDEKPEEEQTPEEKEVKEKADAEAKKTEEAEAKETERLDKKAEKLKKTVDEVKELESTEKTEVERIEKTAKDEGITVEEVKENEGKDVSLAERHGNDPIKVARALRKEQSEYGKLNAEVEDLREYKTQSEAHRAKFNEEQFNDRMEKGREDIIDTYRKKFPDDAGEEVSDDAVFERGKAMIKEGFKKKAEAEAKVVEDKAEDRRDELIKSLPAEYKEHISEVKKALAECEDIQVLDKEFDVVYIADYIRGKKFTPDYVKSIEDASYKRGTEQAKIIPKIPPSKSSTGKKTSSAVSGMTQEQRERAESMYAKEADRQGWTKEQMWEAYMRDDVKDDF